MVQVLTPIFHPPQHGGNLQRAMAQYGGTLSTWIDCSTGIAPTPYPLPTVPAHIWQRLPDQQDGLISVASRYYGCAPEHLLAVAGSQAAIQALPTLRSRSRVGIMAPSYAEHAWCWQQAGHVVIGLEPQQLEEHLHHLDVLIVVNPNNPTGQQYSKVQLRYWLSMLQQHDGWLIVDEAFADLDPQFSLMADSHQRGLIVLRSVGKFFGLAGLRLGFVGTDARLRKKLQDRLGLWSVNGVAEWAGQLALNDLAWQHQQRQALAAAGQWMRETLATAGLVSLSPHPMLHWCPQPHALAWQKALAQQHVWCRVLEQPDALRFGLIAPHQYDDFQHRLQRAAQDIRS
ncbi:MAG: hypothetical protein RLY58_1024 [Pseudomonadota bacterium]|jgi:L-threonine-O-3-phosphate decarboxylase